MVVFSYDLSLFLLFYLYVYKKREDDNNRIFLNFTRAYVFPINKITFPLLWFTDFQPLSLTTQTVIRNLYSSLSVRLIILFLQRFFVIFVFFVVEKRNTYFCFTRTLSGPSSKEHCCSERIFPCFTLFLVDGRYRDFSVSQLER